MMGYKEVVGVLSGHDDQHDAWIIPAEDLAEFLLPHIRLPLRRPLTTLAPAVRTALDYAWSFAGQLQESPPQTAGIETDLVLLATLVHAQRSTPGVTRAFIDELLARRSPELSGQDLLSRLAGSNGLPENVIRRAPLAKRSGVQDTPIWGFIEPAAEIAFRTSGNKRVRLRHVLAASILKLDFGGRNSLSDNGFSEQDVKSALLEAVREHAPEESADAWAELLQVRTKPVEPELAGGMSSDRVDPTTGIALAEDAIGVGVYVTMLATLIADCATPMPLSIGVFGAWGSGKSYFMGLLREQVRALASSGRKPYLGSITQISFNAWHYSDTNLWASLGDEIFRQLAGPGTDIKKQRKDIAAELAEGLAENRNLNAESEQARAQAKQLRAQLDKAAANREAKALDLVRALKGDSEIRKQLGRISRQLGVHTEIEQGRMLIAELDGVSRQAAALRRSFASRAGRTALTVAALALIVLAAATFVPAHVGTWLTRGAGATLAGLLAAGVANVGRVLRGLTRLNELADTLRQRAGEAAQKERLRKHAGLIAAIDEAELREKELQAQLDETVARVQELGRELAELAPGRRLYGFLQQRASDSEYIGGMSLVSTMRKDFEKLVELLDDWRRDADRDAERYPDRIVLYIDDLDRCSPPQVFAVLQAVHLLLALDLFTVVVGVDPEWLRRSVAHQHPHMFEARPEAPPGGADLTPEGYLEKIFNIPFVLPPLTAGGLSRLMRRLATDRDGASRLVQQAEQQLGAGTGAEAAQSVRSGGAEPIAVQVGGELRAEQGSEVAAASGHGGARQEPQPLRAMTEPELRMIEALAGLIRNPRDAKRLLNLYRLVRSTRDLAPAARFLGDDDVPGEYQAVIILLGLLTAQPRLFCAVLDAPASEPSVAGGLMRRPDTTTWSEFAAGFQPRLEAGAWSNEIVGALSAPDVAPWARLADGVAPAGKLVTQPDLTTFRSWADQIRRFTFLPGQTFGAQR